MKKNKMMRIAAGVFVLVMLSFCLTAGTFSKYTTSVNSSDSARVATWGFGESSIDLTDLFSTAYSNGTYDSVKSAGDDDVIAPGTSGEDTFTFKYDGVKAAPEVAYNFKVSTDGSSCAEDIQKNANIQWKLDSGEWGTWEQLLASIEALSGEDDGDKNYGAGNLPTAFTAADDTHTVKWQWTFDKDTAGDTADTKLGNKSPLDSVTLKITITATQID